MKAKDLSTSSIMSCYGCTCCVTTYSGHTTQSAITCYLGLVGSQEGQEEMFGELFGRITVQK